MKKLLLDYLTISFKYPDHFEKVLIDSLNLPKDEIELIKSHFGLANCIYYDGISIHFDDELVILEMSGKGCRTCEDLNPSFDWYFFIHSFDNGILHSSDEPCYVHISRIDIALDDIDNSVVDIPLLQKYVRAKKYVCASRYVSCIEGTRELAVYFGSPKSTRRLRIYDKRLEQKLSDDSPPWVRYEFQLRDENALSFYLNLRLCNGDFSKCYFGVLSNYLNFVSKPRDDVGHHTERLSTVKWWSDFLGNVSELKNLYLPGREYSLHSVESYFSKQCASTVKTLYLVHKHKSGGDVSSFLDMVDSASLNAKQKTLYENYLGEYENN